MSDRATGAKSILGNQRGIALLLADDQSWYLGLHSPPGTGPCAGGQARLVASKTCSEDGFVTSLVLREKWTGKWRGERERDALQGAQPHRPC